MTTQPHHTAACFAPPALLAAYRALWTEVWDDWRVSMGLHCKTVNEEIRAVVLAMLVEGVPVETARTVTHNYMKGLK